MIEHATEKYEGLICQRLNKPLSRSGGASIRSLASFFGGALALGAFLAGQSMASEPVNPAPHSGVPARIWFVQIGSFADQGNAQTTLSLLQNIGYHGKSKAVSGPSGTSLYRVSLGPFLSEAVAQQALDKVLHHGYAQARLQSTLAPESAGSTAPGVDGGEPLVQFDNVGWYLLKDQRACERMEPDRLAAIYRLERGVQLIAKQSQSAELVDSLLLESADLKYMFLFIRGWPACESIAAEYRPGAASE